MKTLLSVLALSALATAQSPALAASLHTATDLGVFANRTTDAARSGRDVSAGLGLSAVERTKASSASKVGVGRGASAFFAWEAKAEGGNRAGTLGASAMGLTAGPQAYAFGLRSRTAVTGKLVLEFSGRASNGGAAATIRHAGATISFRADGQVHTRVIPGVTVNASGLRIGVQIVGKADASNTRSPAGYGAKLSITFKPDVSGGGCVVAPHQRSCRPGGLLQGQIARNPMGGATLNMKLTGALPNAIGIAFVSPNGRTFPILNSSCIFFRTAIVARTFRTDRAGNAQTAVHFPVIAGSAFYIQEATAQLSSGALRIATSNSLVVKCR